MSRGGVAGKGKESGFWILGCREWEKGRGQAGGWVYVFFFFLGRSISGRVGVGGIEGGGESGGGDVGVGGEWVGGCREEREESEFWILRLQGEREGEERRDRARG